MQAKMKGLTHTVQRHKSAVMLRLGCGVTCVPGGAGRGSCPAGAVLAPRPSVLSSWLLGPRPSESSRPRLGPGSCTLAVQRPDSWLLSPLRDLSLRQYLCCVSNTPNHSRTHGIALPWYMMDGMCICITLLSPPGPPCCAALCAHDPHMILFTVHVTPSITLTHDSLCFRSELLTHSCCQTRAYTLRVCAAPCRSAAYPRSHSLARMACMVLVNGWSVCV